MNMEFDSSKKENFLPNHLATIGKKILEKNELPEDFMLDSIMNTSLGINFISLAMARSQSQELQNLWLSMANLEAEIFKPEVIKNLTIYDKLNLLEQCRRSFKFRMDFIRDVQKSIDWKSLMAEIQKLGEEQMSDGKISKNSDAYKNIKTALAKFINSEDLS